MPNQKRQVEEFIGNTYTNNKTGDIVQVTGGFRESNYLWLECKCLKCGKQYDKPVRHSNLERGGFTCPHCHPEREFAWCNVGDAQPYRFNIKQKNNTSGYVGVDYQKKSNKWRARLNYNKQYYNLGLFDTAEEAHNAREQKRRELGLVNMNRFTKEND